MMHRTKHECRKKELLPCALSFSEMATRALSMMNITVRGIGVRGIVGSIILAMHVPPGQIVSLNLGGCFFHAQPRIVTRECWNIGAFPRTAPWARPFAAAAGGNPKVFFECSIGGKPAGRIVFELFNDVVPKVSEPTTEQHRPCPIAS